MEKTKYTFQKVDSLLKKVRNIKNKELRCLNCDRILREYDGKYGKFMGCPNFAQDEGCKETYKKD